MKFVTRARVKVDRVACPWVIKRFVDPAAEFLFVDPGDVISTSQREGAIPFDVPDVELGHRGPLCTFDAILEKYHLDDPALLAMARIIRGADTSDRNLTAESPGLYAIASGFAALSPEEFADDYTLLDVEFPMYDALYAYCRGTTASR
ncbi:MAG TPA: chromate resistance protein ChrB domain-containing protein [Candidatus Nitrosotalea sp.]|nr:chromate resistance protein ChrB domain-containing protein [Candidatus Nitrosotalea sp.]